MACQLSVVVYDPLWEVDWSYDVERDRLAGSGVALCLPRSESDARAALVEADVVVVSGRTFGAELITRLRRCVGIVCYSVGMDTVDVVAAAAAGIPVTNVPDYCTDEVSDHALALLLALMRRLPQLSARAAAGDWNYQDQVAPIRRMRGQTLGVLGAGRIGRRVAEKARGFGMRTIAYDPYLQPPLPVGLELVSLEQLLSGSDAIAVCASLTETSRDMVNRTTLAALRPGAVLVNVARGRLVDEEALAEALRTGRLAAAALDVRAEEPPDPDADPLRGCPNLLLTPHVAGASVEARHDLHEGAAAAVLQLLAAAGRLGGC